MILHINTKDSKKVKISLKKGKKTLKVLTEDREYGSQVLLPMILKLMKTVNCELHAGPSGLKTLQGIEVETGPGSFTGLRVGVSVANSLAYSLGIPVNGKEQETDLVY